MKKQLNDNLVKLVDILSDGQYHDGTHLGKMLKMTRSAIWKAIKKLEAHGVQIGSTKGKGYVLLEPLRLLDKYKISQQLTHKKIGLDVFEVLTSTNEYLKSFKHQTEIKICLTEKQTHGKGRLNREWYSPFGQNIYLSCYYPFRKDMSELAGLSLVTSLAIIKVLKLYGIAQNLFVKWPNDILYENKKISGSLVEIQGETNGVSHAVIGIGVNVNMIHHSSRHISQPWTSMKKILNVYIDRNDFCSSLINHLISYLHKFTLHGFAVFTEEWLQADCLTNKVVMLKNINEKVQGQVVGINEQGFLIVRLLDGAMRIFSSGDTSIIKETK